jgi:hypothetical protein
MRNTIAVLIVAALSLNAMAATENAATQNPIKVSWQAPEKFTDIRPASESKKRFQEKVMTAFDKMWADFATDLPEGYQIEIVMTDVDLAGDVNPMYRANHVDIRVIKDIYMPRVKLNYVLTGPQQQEIARATDVKIQDMGFMNSSAIGALNREFHYEHEMLKKWFKKTILSQIPAESVK